MKRGKIPFVVLAVLCPSVQTRAVQAASPLTDGWTPRVAEAANFDGGVLPGGSRHADLCSDEIDKTLTTRFNDGWFPEENSPTGSFRWMSAEGHIDVTTRRKGTLVIRMQARTFVADNSLELLADGKSVQSIKLTGMDWQDCLVRIPLAAGMHHLSLRSHQPAAQPPGDSRSLTISVENFQVTLEP